MSGSNAKLIALPVLAVCLLAACSEIQRPQPDTFYAETVPPAKQEFRWSNGKMPRSFDPARAAAAPETDVVRALFEGLTEVDTQTLEAVPAAAEKWSSTDQDRVWTFQLRKNARWSNGRRVTAYDFVDSWKRLLTLGDKTAHRELFQNIVGFQAANPIPTSELPEPQRPASTGAENQLHGLPSNSIQSRPETPSEQIPSNALPRKPEKKPVEKKYGVEATDDFTLQVTLIAPDKDLPKLVAAPIFRPIYGDGSEFVDGMLDNGVVTNGPFNVVLVDKNGISLDRSDTYWNKAAVKLEHVRLVASETADAALDAYKKGELDALTNAQLEPLALKLLAPYDDFRQTTFSALNLYKFDDSRPPFNDRRVREALAIAIDRDQLVVSELDGATEPADTFLALDGQHQKIGYDPARAKKLLESAGFPNAAGLAPVKLLINRNDTQMRVARAVARMWKQTLNIDTEITAKELAEVDAADGTHEYDLARRGVVMPTADETVSLWAVFGTPKPPAEPKERTIAEKPSEKAEKGGPSALPPEPQPEAAPAAMTEDGALYDLRAIPLYFPRTYSLVKPYVHGFEVNGLDAVYLPGVSIDSNWQPDAQKRGS